MTRPDRERRRLFIATFQPIFFWPSDTMAVKCWRYARKNFINEELDYLINALVDVHNSRVERFDDACATNAHKSR